MTQIVVIEDNVQNARMANKLLKRAGYEVSMAEDGESGLTTVFESQPDLILIDLGLPDIDGQTVIGLIRQQANLKTVPIIAFTAWPPDEAHDMATRYGCDGVITKPINTRTFADQIGAFLVEKKGSESDTGESATSPDEPESTSKAETTAPVEATTATASKATTATETKSGSTAQSTGASTASISPADKAEANPAPELSLMQEESVVPPDKSQENAGEKN